MHAHDDFFSFFFFVFPLFIITQNMCNQPPAFSTHEDKSLDRNSLYAWYGNGDSNGCQNFRTEVRVSSRKNESDKLNLITISRQVSTTCLKCGVTFSSFSHSFHRMVNIVFRKCANANANGNANGYLGYFRIKYIWFAVHATLYRKNYNHSKCPNISRIILFSVVKSIKLGILCIRFFFFPSSNVFVTDFEFT